MFFVFGVWRGIEGNISGLSTRNMNEYSMLDLINTQKIDLHY